MNHRHSKAWQDFLEKIESAKKNLKFEKNEECFYRGHLQENYQLQPGLFRGLKGNPKEIPDELWSAEYSMFYEFRARAKEVHQGNLTDWDILFYMQHHKCRTRLLDWTENFTVALYFSLSAYKQKECLPTIWMLNPYRLNEKYHDSRDLYSPEYLDYWDGEEEEWISYSDTLVNDYEFWWDEPIALYPIRRVDRLTTQGGYFTIHGNDIRPIEKIISQKENIWKKIVLPIEAIKDAINYLEMAGINDFTMFPDLDGLSQYLTKKYFQ